MNVWCTRELLRPEAGEQPAEVWHAIDGPLPAEGRSHPIVCDDTGAIGVPTTPGVKRQPDCPDCQAILEARPEHART